MPDPVVVPAPAAVSSGSAPAAGDPSNSPDSGRNRFAQLTAQREDLRRSRDQAVAVVTDLRGQLSAKDQQIAELSSAVSELRTAVEGLRQKPRTPFADFAEAPDDQLAALATTGRTDPVTGQPLPPDPYAQSRALLELADRRAEARAEAKVKAAEQRMREQLTAERSAQVDRQAMESHLLSLYGPEVGQAESPIRKMAAQLAEPFVKQFGADYAASPKGLIHLFAESNRLLVGDEASRLRKENERLRGELVRFTNTSPAGHVIAPAPDGVKDALTRRTGRTGVRDAIAKTGLFQSFFPDNPPTR